MILLLENSSQIIYANIYIHVYKLVFKDIHVANYWDIFHYLCSQYEGCSNMNASSFITFVTNKLRQNGIRFYKGLYATFKLAPGLKKNTVYLLSYSPLNEGHFSILTNSMLQTYQ